MKNSVFDAVRSAVRYSDVVTKKDSGVIIQSDSVNLDNQMVLHRTDEIKSNLDAMADQLYVETSPFNESFPLFNYYFINNIDMPSFNVLNKCCETIINFFTNENSYISMDSEVVNGVISNPVLLESVSPNLIQNIITSIQHLSQYIARLLGMVGDITLNEIIVEMSHFNFSLLGYIDIYPLLLIPAALIYKSIVNSYVRHKYPYSLLETMDKSRQENWLRTRKMALIKHFLLEAPLFTVIIFGFCNKSIIDAFTIKDVKVDISTNLLYLFLIPKLRSNSNIRNMSSSNPSPNQNKGNENKNDNTNKKKGIKSIFNIIIPIFGLILGFIWYGDVNNLVGLLKTITLGQVLICYCVVVLLIIIDYLIKIYLLVSFRRNKIKLSDFEYLPTFLYKRLEEQELTSKCNLITYRIFLDLYVGEIKSHLFFAVLIIIIAYINQYI